jgi:hypothetical protein
LKKEVGEAFRASLLLLDLAIAPKALGR